MAFNENLKETIACSGLQQKELEDKTKIPIRTIQKYIQTNSSKPPVENAVKLAQALGVTVEYLVTGKERPENSYASLGPELQQLIRSIKSLPKDKQRKVIKIAMELVGLV